MHSVATAIKVTTSKLEKKKTTTIIWQARKKLKAKQELTPSLPPPAQIHFCKLSFPELQPFEPYCYSPASY